MDEVQQGTCMRQWIMQGNMAYGDGLPADEAAFFREMLRSVRTKDFEGEGWVYLWKVFCVAEKDSHLKWKLPAKRKEVCQEKDPAKETTKSLFENGDELYRGDSYYGHFSLNT
jgi:hypothetical protein